MDEFLFEREGSAVVLSCGGLGGGANEGTQWLKDNKRLRPSHNGEVWLANINHTHQGEYTCSYKQQRFNYFLIVQG